MFIIIPVIPAVAPLKNLIKFQSFVIGSLVNTYLGLGKGSFSVLIINSCEFVS